MPKLGIKFKESPVKERFSAGIDLGTHSIKAVKLKIGKDKTELSGFIFEPAQADPTEILKKIKSAFEVENVNVSVSGASSLIRYVSFPKMTPAEFKQALKFEAQKHVPFPIAETNLDGYILKDDLSDNKMLVLIAAAKKDLVSSRLKLIEGSGLKVNLIDIDSLALVNGYNLSHVEEPSQKAKAIALLNIGSSLANLNILESGAPRLSRDIHIAGNNFTQKIADALGMNLKDAEKLKVSPDKDNSGKVITAVEAVLSNLAIEIRTSFDYYESQSSSTVAKIFLSGGGAKFSGLKDMLANLLGIEVEFWDALDKLDVAAGVDSEGVKNLSGQLNVAFGLALR